MQVQEDIVGLAQEISLTNATTQQKDYSKSSSFSVSLGDVVDTLTRPDKLINTEEEGKITMTLAKAEYTSADQKINIDHHAQSRHPKPRSLECQHFLIPRLFSI